MSDECTSKYTVASDLVLTCEYHYGLQRVRRHQAKHMGLLWYWADEEADKEE